jgi:hypothetical protein
MSQKADSGAISYKSDSLQQELSERISAVNDSLQKKLSLEKADTSDVVFLRYEARLLRQQAAQFYSIGKELSKESGTLSFEVKRLEKRSDELEDQASQLLNQASLIQTGIRTSQTVFSKAKTMVDTTNLWRDSSGVESMKDQKILMLQMRNNADNLLIKVKKASIKAREMKEFADTKDDLADQYCEKAEQFDSKAEELEKKAASLEEKENQTPFAVRFPWSIGHQVRFSAIGPYNDHDAHTLVISGLNFLYFINKRINTGIEDISFHSTRTLYGKRTAISASPVVTVAYFPAKRCELGGGVGLTIQGQVGADRSSKAVFAPFIKLYNETWIWKHFSIGPVVKCSYLINGNYISRSLPSDKAGALPTGSFWISLGIIYTLHL